jgi:outer membrane protein TolC
VSRLQLRLSENEVERQVEQYYWQLVSLQEKLKTIDAVEAMLTDIHKDVEVAVRAGVAMPNDLMQVQLRQNDIESQKLKLNNAVGIVKMLMAQYCGLASPDFCIQEVIVGDSDEVSVPEPLPNDRQQALQQLSEYQLLGKQVEAARIERCLAVGQNLPTVAIGAGYNYHNLLDNNHTFGMVFATFSLPISDWWGGLHAIKRKKIAYQKALDEQRDKAELLDIRMQRAWNNVVEARQQLDIARRSIKQAEENLRLNRDYYRAGTSKMSDLLEAQLLCQQANDHHTDAFADLQNKLLEYRQSVGQ